MSIFNLFFSSLIPSTNNTYLYNWFIIIVFLAFGIHLYKKYLQSKNNIKNVMEPLQKKGRNSEFTEEDRIYFREQFKKNKGTKEAWLEFDESLVVINGKVHNTIDASFFFNPSSLAGQFIDSKLIASIPGILTALGVLGTFYGLSKGLAGVEMGGDTEVMKTGISLLLEGAGTAFMTSLWGVTLSLVYNIAEKILERNLQNKITELQVKIDEIFPRKTAESQLQDISSFTNESMTALQGLAEQIGSQLQRAMSEVTKEMGQTMSTALRETLGTALERLNGGNEEALGSLLNEFMGGFKELASAPGEQMKLASEQSRDTFNDFSNSMNNFITKFDERLLLQEQRDIERNDALKKVVEDIGTQSELASVKLRDGVDALIVKLGDEVGKTLADNAELERQRNKERQQEIEQQKEREIQRNEVLKEVVSGIAEQSDKASIKLQSGVKELISKLGDEVNKTIKENADQEQKRNKEQEINTQKQEQRDIERNDALKNVVADIATQSGLASIKLRDGVDALIVKLGDEVGKTLADNAELERQRNKERQQEIEQQKEREIQRNEVLKEVVSGIAEQSDKASIKLQSGVKELISKLGDEVNKTIKENADQEQKRNKEQEINTQKQEQRDIERNDALKNVVADIATQSGLASSKLRDGVEKLILKLGDEVSKTIQENAELEKERSQERISETERIDKLVTQQTDKISMLIKQGEELNRSVLNVGEANNSASIALNEVATKMKQTGLEFANASNSIQSGVKAIGSSVENATQVVSEISTKQKENLEQIKSLNQTFKNQQEELNKIIETINNLGETSQERIDELIQHQEKFVNGFEDYIEISIEKINKFLNEYTKIVQENTNNRWNDWNDKTNEYSASMKNVIDAMAGIVDEIETKINR